jgi:hypothetical protein
MPPMAVAKAAAQVAAQEAQEAAMAMPIESAPIEAVSVNKPAIVPSISYVSPTINTPTVTTFTQASDINVKCFEANKAKKDYIQYTNNKLAFNSSVSSNGTGCLSDRPTNFLVKRGVRGSGFDADGNCNDYSGINISNEPTHIRYDDKSGNRLLNTQTCVVYDANGLRKAAETAVFDFTSGWSYENNMLIPKSDRNKALMVNDDNSISINDKQTNNLKFLWEREGNEFRNLKTNKCLNVGSMNVTECVGPTRHTRWDYLDNKLLKNRLTNKCISSDGKTVSIQNCNINDSSQRWSIENNGNIVKHSSGTCLAQKLNNSKTELYMADCTCTGIIPGEESEQSYLNYVNNFAGGCNVDNWGYDKVDDSCLYIASQNYQILDKLIKWCDKNQDNQSVNKYCMEFMKYNDMLQYYSRFCSEENGVGEKPLCVKIATDSDVLILDDKARDFIKIKWDEAMYKSCENGMVFTKKNKDENKFRWKYTVNEMDEECLTNWTFRDEGVTPSVDTIISKTTSMGDTGYWCPIVNGSDDPRLNCASHSKTLNFLKNESKYSLYNDIWKEEGAGTELPFRLYKKFVFTTNASSETWRTYIRNEFKVTDQNIDKIHFAYFALFYGGFPIRVSADAPFGPRYYSLNGKNFIFKESNYGGVKVARVTNTPKGPTGLTPGYDIIVAPYRDYFANINGVKKKLTDINSNYYLFVSNDGKVKGVTRSGVKTDINITSPFENKDIETDHYNNTWFFILILIIVYIFSIVIKFKLFAFNNNKFTTKTKA